MKFNREKCKILHLAKKNERSMYKMVGREIWLKSSTCEKELGALVNHKFNISQQSNATAKKAFRGIQRSIESRIQEVMILHYSALDVWNTTFNATDHN